MMIKETISNFETFVIAIKRIRDNNGVELPEHKQRWEYLDSYFSETNYPLFSTQNRLTFSSAKTAYDAWNERKDILTPNIPPCYDINTLCVFKKNVYITIEEEMRIGD